VKLWIASSVVVALVIAGATFIARQVSYVAGPIPDLSELREAVREGRDVDVERYCDKAAIAASFEPLVAKYGEVAVFDARNMALLSLVNIEVVDVGEARATAVGHYGASNLDVTTSLYEVRYEVAEVSDGNWVVVSVTNPEEVVTDVIEWGKQFGL